LLIELKLRFKSNYAHGFAVSEASTNNAPASRFKVTISGLLELKLRFNSINNDKGSITSH